jgi:hypothetical protein
VSARTLWTTTLRTVRDVDGWVSAVENTDLGRALTFAMVTETALALSFLPLVTFGWIGLAELGLVPSPSVVGLVTGSLGIAVGFAALLVGLHVLFGASIELHARLFGERRRSPGSALCFALYACGWDLLTSPLGLWLCATRADTARLGDVMAAARVPRTALLCYFVTVRAVPPGRASAVITSSFVVPLVLLVALGFGAIGLWLWWVVSRV